MKTLPGTIKTNPESLVEWESGILWIELLSFHEYDVNADTMPHKTTPRSLFGILSLRHDPVSSGPCARSVLPRALRLPSNWKGPGENGSF